RVTLEDEAHLPDRPGEGDFSAKELGAIGRGENSAAHVEPDLAPVDIERGDHFDVRRSVWPDLPVHQADSSPIPRGAVVKIYPLSERTGALAVADHGREGASHGTAALMT